MIQKQVPNGMGLMPCIGVVVYQGHCKHRLGSAWFNVSSHHNQLKYKSPLPEGQLKLDSF